jgi:hypothetical protein
MSSLLPKSAVRLAGLIVGLALVAAQLVPVRRDNPPVQADLQAPEPVKQILQRSCYDCHSNETRWPWWSRVAPASWLVAWDVREAREELNFSSWEKLRARKRAEMREEIWEEVDEGEMPLWYYLPAHPEARLGADEQAILRAWAERGEPRDES